MDKTALRRARWRAALIHLGCSAVLASAAAALVFLVWYPWPYSVLAGGIGLFILITGVDVVMGPLITLVVFVLFAWLYMGTKPTLNYLWAGLCLTGAVFFIFRDAG